MNEAIQFLEDVASCKCPHCKASSVLEITKRGLDTDIPHVQSWEYKIDCGRCGLVVVGKMFSNFNPSILTLEFQEL